MKEFFSAKLTTGCMAILLATGQVGGCSNKEDTGTHPEPIQPETETLLRGIPLSCYVEVGPKGIHPSITSSTTELINSQSTQWAEIALEYANMGDLDQAIALTEKIEDYLTRNQTLVELIGQLAAQEQYDRAKQLVTSIREYEAYKAKAFARIGRYYAIAGNHQAANEMFSEAIAFTQTLDAAYIQPMALAEIAIEYAGAGKESEAMELVAAIQDETNKAMALSGIATALAETQSVSKGLQIVQQMTDDYYQAQALTNIAQNIAQQVTSSTQLNSIVQTINQIEDETNQKAALAEMVMIYIRRGEFDQAAELTKTLLGDRWLLPGIIAEYARTGQIDEITALINSMEMDASEYWQNRALIEMANSYAQLGDFQGALQFANGIDSPDIKSSALMAIAQQYIQIGEYRQALTLLENLTATTTNEAISYDIESYFAPLVNCAIAASN